MELNRKIPRRLAHRAGRTPLLNEKGNMNNIEMIGYKRTMVGKIGGAFERVAAVNLSAYDVAGEMDAMLTSLGASSKIVIQMDPGGQVIVVTPEHDEAVHGFESNPFHISLKPAVGATRFTHAGSVIVSLEEAGATVAKMAA